MCRAEHLARLAALVLIWVALALPAAAEPVAIAARLGPSPERTRFVLEFSEPVSFTVLTLSDPYRIVIDLPEVTWQLPPETGTKGGGLVARYRYGQFEPGTQRVVIDLTGPAKVRGAFIAAPEAGRLHRLVVDLEPTPAKSFAEDIITRQVAGAPAPGGTGPQVKSAMPAPERAPTPQAQAQPPAAVGANPPPPSVAAAGTQANPPPAAATEAPAPNPPPVALQQPAVAPEPAAQETSAAPETKVAATRPPPSSPPAKGKKRDDRRVIVIDAGHGGVDPGAVSVSGAYEKDITLPMALALKKALEQDGRYKAVLTRSTDVFLRLRERVEVARTAGADLFISLHADSVGSPIGAQTLRGASVYTLSEQASDKEAEALAAKENKADIIAGVDLGGKSIDVSNILIDLAQRESMNEAARFAALLVDDLKDVVPVLDRSHRFAGFAVLKAPDIPSVLIEMGYLSNKVDEQRLRSDAQRAKLASTMRRAVDSFFANRQAKAQ
ncbi:MAG: N-acetylmuramoyl-L-alanine amidase [Alphaproteobacteria bacterium]